MRGDRYSISAAAHENFRDAPSSARATPYSAAQPAMNHRNVYACQPSDSARGEILFRITLIG